MLLLVCLFALGCSQNVKVTGKVTYSDNGEPVGAGVVIFTGEKEIGQAAIKDGRYSIGRINDGDGIPLGTYTVASDSLDFSMGPTIGIDGALMEAPKIDKELYYTKEPKTIEVKKSMTYDFTVERGSRPL
jgi:hypothetical protein